MAFRRKPRKSPINDFVSMIVPDRIEEAYDRVESYFTEHLKLSFDTPEGVAGVLDELIRDHGQSVRQALYALLCEENGALRPLVSGGVGSGAKATVGFLVPVLAAQFALAPAVALLVATLVIKAVSVNGEKALCEELIRLHRKTIRYRRATETQQKVKAAAAAARKKRNPAGQERRPPRSHAGGTGETSGPPPRRRAKPGGAAEQSHSNSTRTKSGPAAKRPPQSEGSENPPRRRVNRKPKPTGSTDVP